MLQQTKRVGGSVICHVAVFPLSLTIWNWLPFIRGGWYSKAQFSLFPGDLYFDTGKKINLMRCSLVFMSWPVSEKFCILAFLPEAWIRKGKVQLYVITATHIGDPEGEKFLFTELALTVLPRMREGDITGCVFNSPWAWKQLHPRPHHPRYLRRRWGQYLIVTECYLE